jgi:hypothetical protein
LATLSTESPAQKRLQDIFNLKSGRKYGENFDDFCIHLPTPPLFLAGDKMTGFDNRLNTSWWVLRIGLGVGPIITGLDKYFNKLTDWGMYLSPLATKVVPVSTPTFMHIVGVVEIVAGLVVLSRWTKIGSYVVMLWLLGIAVNLLTTNMFYDLAMRDVEIALGAFALSQLSAVREQRAVVGAN